MVKTIEIRDMVLYLDGNNFVLDIMRGCEIQNSKLVPQTRWLSFNPNYMDKHIDKTIKEVVEYIFYLEAFQNPN